jgi:hypothetical protein
MKTNSILSEERRRAKMRTKNSKERSWVKVRASETYPTPREERRWARMRVSEKEGKK